MGQIFDFSDIEKNEKSIKKTWQEFRDALSKGNFSFDDNGTGFDPEDLPHLFERFYRGKSAVGNGIGIGLALAKSIIELQNGTIVAYNLQNGGACFEIRLFSH